MIHCHTRDEMCRVDYLLVSKERRNIGAGSAPVSSFVDFCREHHIVNCYLWPNGKSAEKIYYNAEFRKIKQ